MKRDSGRQLHKSSYFRVFVTLFSGVISANAEVIDIAYNPATGNHYYLLSQSSWTDAQEEAESLGGDLVTINNASEQTWVYSTFTNSGAVDRALWIGLFDGDSASNSADRITRRSEFSWISGQPRTYTNWSPFEPNNPNSPDPVPGEHYVHIWNPSDPQAGRWNNFGDSDSILSSPIHGVVEVTLPEVPELSIIRDGNEVVLQWRIQPLQSTSTLESSLNLAPDSWTAIVTQPVMFGAFWSVRVPMVDIQKFFRLRLEAL